MILGRGGTPREAVVMIRHFGFRQGRVFLLRHAVRHGKPHPLLSRVLMPQMMDCRPRP